MPPKSNNNSSAQGRRVETRKRGKRGLYVEESKAKEELVEKKKQAKLDQWKVENWKEIDPINTLMKFEVIPKGKVLSLKTIVLFAHFAPLIFCM